VNEFTQPQVFRCQKDLFFLAAPSNVAVQVVLQRNGRGQTRNCRRQFGAAPMIGQQLAAQADTE
jgi:hypothetical protein